MIDLPTESDPVRVIHADCMDVLREMPDESVDAIVTDPPYCSGARTSATVVRHGGVSHRGKWATKPLDCDQMTTVGYVWLIRELASEASRILVRGGSLVCFTDWRQYPNTYGAIESCNLRIQALVVWDKKSIALGNGFRNQHELIIHAAKGVPEIYDRSVSNVIGVPRLSSSEDHPTEKPVDIFRPLIRVVCPVGGVVLDPFAGVGSSGLAAIAEGRRCILIERDPQYVAIARKRVEAAMCRGPGSLLADVL